MGPDVLENPIAGRYVAQSRIGAGGMGNVLRALDLQTGDTVALKLLDADAGDTARARFRQEIETLAQLRAPGIVPLLGHGVTASGLPFVVMEWIDGEDLGARLHRGVLDVDETLTLLRAVSLALIGAHERGIVHRDLKPSNLMLRQGRLDQPVLIDFGIARPTLPSSLTRTGSLIGTPVYMAPEQARGDRELPLSTDIFALGCVAFQCLAGSPPFAADHIAAVLARILFEDPPSILSLRADVPPSLAALLARMLDRDPQRRPANAGALHALLLELDHGPGAHAHEPPTNLEHVLERQLFSVLVGVPGQVISQAHITLLDDDATVETVGDDPLALAITMGGRAERMLDGTIVVVFASQTSAGDRALLAARCALQLNQRWPQFSLALTTGHGQVHGRRAFGEAVDRAHRLLAAQAPDGPALLLDELSAELLDTRFEIVVHHDHDGVYALLHERPQHGAPRKLLGKPLPCLGRAHELGVLELTLRTCIDEREAHLVVVSGEPGSGKSRLRHEFVRRCCAPNHELLLLRGDGDPSTSDMPHAILGRLIARAAGFGPTTDTDSQRRAIMALVERFGVTDGREHTIEFLAIMCAIDLPARHSPALRAALRDPALMRERCMQAWLTLLRHALRRGPIVIIVDDLQWADRLSVDMLLHTHTLLASTPLLILALGRGELFERLPELRRELDRVRNRQRMRLGGLGRGACERLIREALTGEIELTDTLVERLILQASGNALFLEELIRAVANGDLDNFPKTVEAMLQARMDQLDRVPRRVLLAASVLGHRFDHDELALLLGGLSPNHLELALEHLIGDELLERDVAGGQLQFRHASLRDTAYHLLAPDSARELHRLVAEHLIERSDARPVVIAEHLLAAGQGERAAGHFLRGAEQASAANALDEALSLAERGLAAAPIGALANHLVAIQTWALGWLGRWTMLVEQAEPTLARLEPGSTWWSRCIAMLIGVGFLTGDEDLLSHTTTQLFAATPHADALVHYLDALNVGIGSATMIGRFQLAARYHRRALEVADDHELDDDARRLLAFAEASVASCVELDLDRGLQAAETAVTLAREVGDGRYLVFSRLIAAECHAWLGRSQQAVDLARAALAISQQLANPYLQSYARVSLASLLATRPRNDAAFDEALALTAPLLDVMPPYPGWATAVRGHVMLRRGELSAAETLLGEALRMLTGTPRLLARTWLSLADVRHALGRREAAREAADAALDIIEPEGGWELLLALRARARVYGSEAARGRLDGRLAEVLERVHDEGARGVLRAAFGG